MKRIVLALVVLALVCADDVGAQVPPPNTPTPMPTPTETPEGWLPRPDWLRPSCFWPGRNIYSEAWYRQCYAYCRLDAQFPTPTGAPTIAVPTLAVPTLVVPTLFTPTPAPTPMPLPTPTSTPVPTPTPTATPAPTYMLQGWYKLNSGDDIMEQPEDVFVSSSHLSILKKSGYIHHYSYDVSVQPNTLLSSCNSTLKVTGGALSIDWWGVYSYDYDLAFCTSGRDGIGCGNASGRSLKADVEETICSNSSADRCLSCQVDSLSLHIVIYPVASGNYDNDHGLIFHTKGIMGYGQRTIIITPKLYDYLPPVPTPTPAPTSTPAPTPTPGPVPNWCFTGWYEETPPAQRTPWDDVVWSSGGCYTIVPGGDVAGWFVLPGFEVCITNITLPEIQDFFPFVPQFVSIWSLVAMIPAGALFSWLLKQWGG